MSTTFKERLEAQVAEEQRREALLIRYLYAVALASAGAIGAERCDPGTDITWPELGQSKFRRLRDNTSRYTLTVQGSYEVAGVPLRVDVIVYGERKDAVYGPDLEQCGPAVIATKVSIIVAHAERNSRLATFDVSTVPLGLPLEWVEAKLTSQEGEQHGAIGIPPQPTGQEGDDLVVLVEQEMIPFAAHRQSFVTTFRKELEHGLMSELFPRK